MRNWGRGLLIGGMLAAVPAHATVIYTFTGSTGSFSYQADDFVNASRRVAASDLSACSAGPGQCTFLDLLPNASPGQDEFDLGAIYYPGQPYGYTAVSRYYVTAGAFGREGVFAAGAGNVLRVASVPEPATWSVMLAGFGAIGIALRRRRRTTFGYRAALVPPRPSRQE